MDEIRPEALAARVVAWHNRHPLARRITAAQVTSVGLVALPFVARASNIAPAALLDLPTLALADAAVPNSHHRAHATLREKARAQTAQGAGAAQGPTTRAAPTQAIPPPKPGNAVQRLRGWFKLRAARRRAQTLARDRAQARAQALQMAFSEDFIAPLTPKRVAQWALLHGRLLGLMPEQHPVRIVQTDASLASDAWATTTLYLATAAIELNPPGVGLGSSPKRCRVLLGDGPQPLALGPRHYSTQRVATALTSLMLVVGLGALAPLNMHTPNGEQKAVVAAVKPASAAASAPKLTPQLATAPTAAPADVVAVVDTAVDAVADATVVADAAADTAARAASAASAGSTATETAAVVLAEVKPALPARATPGAMASDTAAPRIDDSASLQLTPGGPTPRQSTVPTVRPQLDEASKAAARQAVADARAARGDEWREAAATPAATTAPTPAATTAPTPARATATPALAAAPRSETAPVPTYALSTRLMRTRAESEQVIVAWRALLEGSQKEPVKVALMAAGDDWRVVSWPFARREDAERARAVLAARGLRAETVDF